MMSPFRIVTKSIDAAAFSIKYLMMCKDRANVVIQPILSFHGSRMTYKYIRNKNVIVFDNFTITHRYNSIIDQTRIQ